MRLRTTTRPVTSKGIILKNFDEKLIHTFDEAIERNELKKRGKVSLRMRQLESTNFIQGELLDLKDERRKNSKEEKRAKNRDFYKY